MCLHRCSRPVYIDKIYEILKLHEEKTMNKKPYDAANEYEILWLDRKIKCLVEYQETML